MASLNVVAGPCGTFAADTRTGAGVGLVLGEPDIILTGMPAGIVRSCLWSHRQIDTKTQATGIDMPCNNRCLARSIYRDIH